MKKKLLIFIVMLILIASVFIISASGATTDEFGTPTLLDGIPTDLTDSNARMVLVDSNGNYTTFPTYYVYFKTNAPNWNWRGEPKVDFTALNTALGLTGENVYSKESIVRIELPDDAKYISGLNGLPKIKEISFSDNSQANYLETFNATPTLEKVYIPPLVKSFPSYMFHSATALKEVKFSEKATITEFGIETFKSCTSLEYIKLPNSLKKIGNLAFQGCAKLKVIVMGAGLESMGQRVFEDMGSAVTVYIPASLYADTTLTIPNNQFHWSGDGNNPKYCTFVFTGTKDEALALQERFAQTTGNERISGAILCTEAEYKTLTDLNIGDTPTSGRYLIYGYNACKAFYNNVHNYEGTGNCLDGVTCTQCKDEIDSFEKHVFKETLEYESFVAQGSYNYYCTNASDCIVDKVSNREAPAIFTINEANGFSSDGDGIAFGGYQLNAEALDEYNRVNLDTPIKYGVLLINPNYLDGKDSFLVNGEVNAENGFMKADMSNVKYTNISISVTGFTGNAENLSIILAIYAYSDVNEVELIQSQETKCASANVTLGNQSLYTVTLSSVKSANSDLSDLGDYVMPSQKEQQQA